MQDSRWSEPCKHPGNGKFLIWGRLRVWGAGPGGERGEGTEQESRRVNILIGVAMNFYLALSSVEISMVLSLQSMSMICHFNSSCLISFSQWGV